MKRTPAQAAEDIGTFTSYDVTNAEMESACPEDGRPVYVGDTAWEVKSHLFDEAGYCSRQCACASLAAYLLETFPENFTDETQAAQ